MERWKDIAVAYKPEVRGIAFRLRELDGCSFSDHQLGLVHQNIRSVHLIRTAVPCQSRRYQAGKVRRPAVVVVTIVVVS